jgi:hypothetical protein
MLMLIDTPDRRYGGAPDPDDERERRWEPIGARIFVPAAGALICLIVAGMTPTAIAFALDALALLLVGCVAREAWRTRDDDEG